MKKINKILNRDLYGFRFDFKLKITAFLLIVSVFEISASTYNKDLKTLLNTIKFYQEEIVITGTVFDETNLPLPGAIVSVKGTTTSTITSIDGKYSILVPKGTKSLLISYTGYTSQEILIRNRPNIDVEMARATNSLDEVVVVGYGTQRKKNVLGAISSIKGENLTLSAAPSVAHALQGKVAGLQIAQNSAQPGGGLSIQIRGNGSVNASNQPLIVVDGFPITELQQPEGGNRYDGGTQGILNSFNPNDIASIEVLKDASAAAIYGTKAANGVILITTKKGATGEVKVDYSASFSYQAYNDGYDVLNLQDWMQVRNEAAREDWDFTNKVYPYSSKTLEEAIANPVNGIPFRRFYSDQQIRDAGKGTDWLSLVTRDGTIQQNNISLRGGTKSTKYFLSGNLYDHKGVVKNSAFKRTSFRFNIDQKLNDYINFGMNMTTSNIKNQNSQLGGKIDPGTGLELAQYENSGIIRSAIQQGPHILARDEFGNYPINPDSAQEPNPYSLLTISDEGAIDRLLTNFYLEIKPFTGLTARVQAGMDKGNSSRNTYLPRTTLWGEKENGRASIASTKLNKNLLDFTLNYSKKIKEDHSFNLLLGYSKENLTVESASVGNSDFITDAFLWNNMNAGAGTKVVGSAKGEDESLSMFARFNYIYKDRYMLTSSVRRDGSGRFAENHKYAIFPSVQVGWDISGESFMDSYEDKISQLKLRFGYGQTGNADFPGRSTAALGAQPGYLGSDEAILIGVFLSRLGNPDLKWETTTEANLGLDFELFKRRLSGSLEIYNREVSDLIQLKDINSYNPVNQVWANVGKTETKGVELTLSTVNIDTENFKWKSTFVYSTYKTNWKERAPDWKPTIYQSYNDPLRAQYSYLADGIMQIGETVTAQPDLYPGQIKIKDINGFQRDGAGNPAVDSEGRFIKSGSADGKIDEADIVLLGSYDPKYSAGFSNTVIYKNFELNFHFNGMFGRKISNLTDLSYGVSAVGVAKNGHNALQSVHDRWTPQNPSTTRPASHFGYTQYSAGDFFLQDASFIRLQNVSLDYRLPSKWFGKYISSAALRLEAQNLFTITKYDGIDPETDGYTAAYPNVKTYTVGIDLKF